MSKSKKDEPLPGPPMHLRAANAILLIEEWVQCAENSFGIVDHSSVFSEGDMILIKEMATKARNVAITALSPIPKETLP